MRPSTRIICASERSRPRDGNSLGLSSCLGALGVPCQGWRRRGQSLPSVTSRKGSVQHRHCRSHGTPLAGNVLPPASRCSVLRSALQRRREKPVFRAIWVRAKGVLPPILVFQAERRERPICFLLLQTVIAWLGSSVCHFSPVSYIAGSSGQGTWFLSCTLPSMHGILVRKTVPSAINK